MRHMDSEVCLRDRGLVVKLIREIQELKTKNEYLQEVCSGQTIRILELQGGFEPQMAFSGLDTQKKSDEEPSEA